MLNENILGILGPMNSVIKINCTCSLYFSNAGIENFK